MLKSMQRVRLESLPGLVCDLKTVLLCCAAVKET